MGDNQFNEYSFDDSFDDSFNESSDEDVYEPPKYRMLDDSSPESHGVKRPREDDMDLEQPVKKYKIDNANFMALYAKAHNKESK